MAGSDCRYLAGYLEDGLTAAELQVFTDHLPHCPGCRQATEEHRRLDQLLERVGLQSSPLPAGLVDRLERRLQKAQRWRRAAWVSGLAAALLVAAGVGVWLTRAPSLPERPVDPPVTRAAPAPPEKVIRPLVQVRVTSPDEVVAVPVPTRNPTVTILWLYPARRPAVPKLTNPSDGSGL
jgi:hypothetical protein